MPKCLSGVQNKAKTVHKYLIIDNSIPNLKKMQFGTANYAV